MRLEGKSKLERNDSFGSGSSATMVSATFCHRPCFLTPFGGGINPQKQLGESFELTRQPWQIDFPILYN